VTSVLVIDDEAPIRLLCKVNLEAEGMDVLEAADGPTGLQQARELIPDVVLLDVMMPGLDGFETARLMRQHKQTATTPVIFVSANNLASADVRKGYAVGAADYLVKPIDADILRAKVSVFVELHHARNEIKRQAAALIATRIEKEREAAYRFIAESIPQQVWTARPDGSLAYVNPIVVGYFDQPSEAILAAGWPAVIHPDDTPLCVARWTASLATGAPYEIEFRLRRSDGSYRWHLGRAVAERDQAGRIVRWFGTNTDIEDRKRVEAELRAAVQSREDLLATVSHDLRGPLGSIVLAASTIDPRGDQALLKQRNVVSRAAARMEQLIRDLLDMASIESGHLSIEPRALVVQEVVTEAIESIQSVAAAKVVDLATELAMPTAQIHGDRGRLLQVFSNILGNAVKFTPTAGKVSLRTRVRDDRYVTFAISDSGPGIRSEELPFVFDRFWQAKETARAGTGLGLAICKGIVQQHGGSIWVESQLGAGTTFFFTMPVAP